MLKMKKFINLFIFLSIIITFVSNVNAKCIVKKPKEKKSEEDKFYLIFVKTDAKYNFPEPGESHKKRHENNQFIDAMISEIHNLIIDNKETFKNVTMLEEINDSSSSLNKRGESDKVKHPYDYDDSNLAYPVSSVENETVIYAYLSKKLVGVVKSMPGVIDVIPDRKIKMNGHYNFEDIKKESKWKNVSIRDNSSLHLSVISQGKYNDRLIGKYDRTYYYPSSAGKDVDLIIFDSGFNFDHHEFDNTNERIVKCECFARSGKIEEVTSRTYCHRTKHSIENHGTHVADSAAGKKYGAAPKVNVYAVVLDGNSMANIFRALEYVRDHLIRPHKTIINMSFGDFFNKNDSDVAYFQKIITDIANLGGIPVASAGNNNKPVYHNKDEYTNFYPCYLKDTICVGGIYNHYQYDSSNKQEFENMKTEYYRKASFSNYGKGVDIYGPGYTKVSYRDDHNDYYKEIVSGTSFASPVVAGVIATIISENPEIKFDKESMLSYLKKIGLKGVIDGIPDGILVNNGKHTVYSEDNVYHGCGVNAGNVQCGQTQCCSRDGQCLYKTDSMCQSKEGCQVGYGTCTVVKSMKEGRCGQGYGSCNEGECCSYDGYCGTTSAYCKAGCQKNYGLCTN